LRGLPVEPHRRGEFLKAGGLRLAVVLFWNIAGIAAAREIRLHYNGEKNSGERDDESEDYALAEKFGLLFASLDPRPIPRRSFRRVSATHLISPSRQI
jgi:hypothetical protein